MRQVPKMIFCIDIGSSSYKINSKNTFFCFIFAFLFSAVYVYLVPWEELIQREFRDAINYINRISEIASVGDINTYSGISYITSEWLWAKLLQIIAVLFIDYNNGLSFLSFISLFTFSYFAYSRLNVLIVLVFLFNPLFIDLILSQVRIALAFSLILLCFHTKNFYLMSLLVVSACLIHTVSLFIVLIILFLRYWVKLFGYGRHLYYFSVFLALFLSLFLEYGVHSVLSMLGDRRASYADIQISSSVLYSSFWFFIAVVLTLKSKIKIEFCLLTSFSIVMMALFFFNSALGLYGQRYVAISIIPILIAINTLRHSFKLIIFLTLFCFQIVQYVYWL